MLGPSVLPPGPARPPRTPDQVVADLRRDRDAYPEGSYMHVKMSQRLAYVEEVLREMGRLP